MPKTAFNDSDCRPVIIYPKMQPEARAHLEGSQSPNDKKIPQPTLTQKEAEGAYLRLYHRSGTQMSIW